MSNDLVDYKSYCEDILIRISNIDHHVDRFGNIFRITVKNSKGNIYVVDKSLGLDEVAYLLSLKPHDVVRVFVDKSSKHETPTIDKIIENDIPKSPPTCKCCGGILSENLGSLVCNNSRCYKRRLSRVYHFFKELNVFRYDEDLVDFVQKSILESSENLSIANSIYTLLNMRKPEYVSAQTILTESLNSINLSLKQGIDKRYSPIIIASFINSLSLPTISDRDIGGLIDIAVYEESGWSIFENLSNLLEERNVDPDHTYRMEVLALSDFLIMDEFTDDTINWI